MSDDQQADAIDKDDAPPEAVDKDKFEVSPLQIAVATVLIVFSAVSKFKVGTVELSGGTPFAALAALVVLWPVLKKIIGRGGTAELFGLKLQINALERRTEGDLGIKLEELRADLETLRKSVGTSPFQVKAFEAKGPPAPYDPNVFDAAVTQYVANSKTGGWRPRTETDKMLIGGGNAFPVSFLRDRLAAHQNTRETAMAAAVCLGAPYPGEDDTEAAKLLSELLRMNSERVRFRAARSVERRARRADTSTGAKAILSDAVDNALRTERAASVQEALRDAARALL